MVYLNCVQSGYKVVLSFVHKKLQGGYKLIMKNYDEMQLTEIIEYLNQELLKGRSMKDIEENDFGVNERVIAKRLARKKIKKIDGQFVLQSGSQVVTKKPIHIESNEIRVTEVNRAVATNDNKEFLDIKKRVEILEKALKEIICVQSGSQVVTNNLDFKIYNIEGPLVAKTVRLSKDIWDKIDKVKELFPHLNYQTILNSLLDEITSKYLE